MQPAFGHYLPNAGCRSVTAQAEFFYSSRVASCFIFFSITAIRSDMSAILTLSYSEKVKRILKPSFSGTIEKLSAADKI